MADNIYRKYVIFGILGIWRLDKTKWLDLRRLTVASCMNMWVAHHLNRVHILYKHSKHGTKHIDKLRFAQESMIFKTVMFFFLNFVYTKCLLTRKKKLLV